MTKQSAESNCVPFFINFESASDRLKMMASSVAFLKEFRGKLEKISRDENCRKKYPNTRLHIADTAFEAEKHTRLISKFGLDSLNELRDSGLLEHALRQSAESFSRSEKILPDAIHGTKKLLQKQFKDLDTSFLDEALKINEKLNLELSPDKERIIVKATIEEGVKVRFPIRLGANPGSKGRISSDAFFGKASPAELVKIVGPIWVPEDCHHLERWEPGKLAERDVDVYGAFVGALKNANELSYLYARRVDEVGTPSISGRDPVTALLVGLAIVAAALFIAGVAIEIGCTADAWSGEICDWGWVLLTAGLVLGGIVCVASGACELVIGLVSVAV